MKTDIKLVPAYDHKQEIGSLFREYTDMRIEGDNTFRDYLQIQNYDEELEHLDAKYGFPQGRLYLVYCDGQPAGCIGLRRIDEQNCEMKRLYVRPAFRHLGIGTLLVQRIISDAEEIEFERQPIRVNPVGCFCVCFIIRKWRLVKF